MITYFAEHEKERRIFQTKFYEIGKLLKVPVSDYIYRLSEVKKKSNTPHYLADCRNFSIFQSFRREEIYGRSDSDGGGNAIVRE